MKTKKKIISLVCASMIGLNANFVSADPGIPSVSVSVKQIKQKIVYNFNEFLEEKFQWQDTVENLISYTYTKYNHILKEVKISYPGITLEDMINNSNTWDKVRFWWLLVFDYSGNLNKLGYKLENVVIKEDKLGLSFLDRKSMENRNKLPYLKMDVDISSLPDYMNVNEIKTFLEGDKNYILKTESGKFFYSIQRSARKMN